MVVNVHGSGANGVLLLANTEAEAQHWMLDRVCKRGGLNKDHFLIHVGADGLIGTLLTHPEIKVVVGLGDEILYRILGETQLLRWRGRPVWLQSYGVWFLSTIAPSKLLARKQPKDQRKRVKNVLTSPGRFTRVVIMDLHKAEVIARDGFKRHTNTDYLYDPAAGAFETWINGYEAALAREPDTLLSWDIETPYKLKSEDEGELEESERDTVILRVSFSYEPHTAVTVPWDAARLPGIKRLLASPGGMVVWNGSTFDVPLVRGEGVGVGGRVYDFMDGWHVLQSDLPKGLEFVTSFYTDLMPWKHLNNGDPQLYSCIDADAALQNALGIREDLKAAGMWDTYMRHAVLLSPVLYEAGVRGNVIDEPARLALLKELEEKEAELLTRAQGMIPMEVRPRKRYKKQPNAHALTEVKDGYHTYWHEEPTGRMFEQQRVNGKVKQCSHCKALNVTKTTHFKGGKKNECKAAGATIEVVKATVTEWDELLPFNPNSSDQMIAYMKHYKHPVGKPKDSEDEDAESADSKHLAKLVKKYGPKHPIYQLAMDLSKVSKAKGTYVVGMAPDANGRVHTTYVNSTSTWRLGSRDVNMQNQGKRAGNIYAKRSRRIIIASPGCKLVQADSSSIEAVMVGWFMGDQDYITLAKKSIHAWLCCKRLGLDFTEANVNYIKKKQKDLYDQMKVTNHMTNYGGSPPVLVEQFPDTFPTLRDAKDAQEYIFAALPQLANWHHEMRVKAQKESFLASPWGHRHYFYDVFTRDRWTGKIKLGKDGKRSIAFMPQNGAGCFMRDNLLIMGTNASEYRAHREWYPRVNEDQIDYLYSGKWRAYMPANVSVHDGYTLDVPNDLVPDAIEYLGRLLTRPVYEMDGLTIGCEIEVGDNWLDMECVKKITMLDEEEMREAA